MGKKNKVVKLTQGKIRYLIRAKTKMLLNIYKFGRKKKELDEETKKLILEVNATKQSAESPGSDLNVSTA